MNQVECSGAFVRNHDGIPDVICDTYHRANGTVDALPCEDCEDALCASYEANLRFEPHLETCSEHPENIEPPDPWEAAAYPFARNH